MKKIKFWEFIEHNIFSLLTIVTGVLVIVLQGIGIIKGDPIQVVILALLTFLATSQVVENNKKFEHLEFLFKDEVTKTILTLNGIEIKKFESADSGYEYLAKRLRQVDYTVDHISMARLIPRWSKAYKAYSDMRDTVLRTNKIRYRYVVNIDVDQKESGLHVLNRLKAWLNNSDIHNLFIGTYNLSSETVKSGFPYPTIMILDSKEVVIYYPGEIGSPEVTYSISHPILVTAFANYFKRVWSHANFLDKQELETLIGQLTIE